MGAASDGRRKQNAAIDQAAGRQQHTPPDASPYPCWRRRTLARVWHKRGTQTITRLVAKNGLFQSATRYGFAANWRYLASCNSGISISISVSGSELSVVTAATAWWAVWIKLVLRHYWPAALRCSAPATRWRNASKNSRAWDGREPVVA